MELVVVGRAGFWWPERHYNGGLDEEAEVLQVVYRDTASLGRQASFYRRTVKFWGGEWVRIMISFRRFVVVVRVTWHHIAISIHGSNKQSVIYQEIVRH
jgi:hypothetical protein